jgi:hypothetical protein
MVRNGQTRPIKTMLTAHPDLVNVELRGGWTPVPLAARFGHWKLAQHLHEQGGYFYPLQLKPIMEENLTGKVTSPLKTAITPVKHTSPSRSPTHLLRKSPSPSKSTSPIKRVEITTETSEALKEQLERHRAKISEKVVNTSLYWLRDQFGQLVVNAFKKGLLDKKVGELNMNLIGQASGRYFSETKDNVLTKSKGDAALRHVATLLLQNVKPNVSEKTVQLFARIFKSLVVLNVEQNAPDDLYEAVKLLLRDFGRESGLKMHETAVQSITARLKDRFGQIASACMAHGLLNGGNVDCHSVFKAAGLLKWVEVDECEALKRNEADTHLRYATRNILKNVGLTDPNAKTINHLASAFKTLIKLIAIELEQAFDLDEKIHARDLAYGGEVLSHILYGNSF